jgi:hypothetical protein
LAAARFLVAPVARRPGIDHLFFFGLQALALFFEIIEKSFEDIRLVLGLARPPPPCRWLKNSSTARSTLPW